MPPGVSYRSCGIEGFISPYLSNIESTSTSPQVLVISAPGAVGKSTLANEIARRKQALIWDLALAPEVGGNSLRGILHVTLARGFTDEYLDYMSDGLQFLIIDALDEGRTKVTETSFQRLLEDITEVAKSTRGLSFVVLGRTNIAETVALHLMESNVALSMHAIDPFDRDQANKYIDNHMGPEQRTPPFLECRDLIFERLAFSVTQNGPPESASAFLHYPPVLDVIATLLREESNFGQLKSNLTNPSAESNQDEPVQLLHEVIDRILCREQLKTLPALQQGLRVAADDLNWDDWASLYTSHEQCMRLLGRVLKINIPAAPSSLPIHLVSRYEELEAIEFAVVDHPFLQGVDRFANRVFEAYLHAHALLGEYGEEAADTVTAILTARQRLPTRLLSAFYLSENGNSADKSKVIVPEHLGIIYDSLISDDSSRSLIRLTVDAPEAAELNTVYQAEVDVEFLTFDEDGVLVTPLADAVTFRMRVDESSTIAFPHYLRDASIAAPCTVELGQEGSEFTIGPNVYINASRLSVQAAQLIVKSQSQRHVEADDKGVVLEASNFGGAPSGNTIPVVYEGAALRVSWPGSEQYPWSQFGTDRVDVQLNHEENVLKAYHRFKRIATSLQSHGKGTLARTKRKIDHRRVLQGALGQGLLNQLLEDQILTLTSGRYFWNPDIAGPLLGVSWQDLRSGQIRSQLRKYLGEFTSCNPDLFER